MKIHPTHPINDFRWFYSPSENRYDGFPWRTSEDDINKNSPEDSTEISSENMATEIFKTDKEYKIIFKKDGKAFVSLDTK